MRGSRWVGAAVLAAAVSGGGAAAARAAQCPSRVGPGDIVSAKTLRAWNAIEYGFGHPRPTGSEAQRKLVDWLERRLDRTRGVRVSELRYRIRRWDATSTGLSLGGAALPVAGPVPYAGGTSAAGVTA